ncbi:MAG: FAD binding domain-containing protein [Phycisphaerae bacterium]
MRDFALIYLNGVRREIRGREALMMLADWLRKEAGLTGTKIVCAEGDCGSCTVLRAFPDLAALAHVDVGVPSGVKVGANVGAIVGADHATRSAPLEFEAMNSCIVTVAQMDGSHIVTVEGMQCGDELSPAQVAMKQCHASQCGYCTPGFVMAISAMLEKHGDANGTRANGASDSGARTNVASHDGAVAAQHIDAKMAANYLTGNLCRCTGYAPIVEAALTVRATEKHSVAGRYSNPAAIADALNTATKSLLIEHDGIKLFAPVSLREAVTFAAQNPGFKVVGAATDMGVQTNKGKPLPRALLSLHLIRDLYQAKQSRSGIIVGARVTLAQLRRLCETSAPELASFLNLFGSPQIKNVATLVGNIANASPIGDTLPFLLIADAVVHVASRPGGKGPTHKRNIKFTDLYVGYKKLALTPEEIITHVSFNATDSKELLRLYKVSQRKDMDISAISGAFSLTLAGRAKHSNFSNDLQSIAARKTKSPPRVVSARIAYGGVAATPIRMPEIEAALVGEFTMEKAQVVAHMIASAITPLSDVRGSAAYRRVTAAKLFMRYASEVLHA